MQLILVVAPQCDNHSNNAPHSHYTITMVSKIFQPRDISKVNAYNGHGDLEPWCIGMTNFVTMKFPGIGPLVKWAEKQTMSISSMSSG